MAKEMSDLLLVKMELDMESFEKQLADAVKKFDRACAKIEKRNARLKRKIR